MKNKLNNLALTTISIAILLTSCYTDKEDLLYGGSSCDISTVSFSNDIMPILSNRCATVGCHVQGGSGTGLFENYAQTKASVDKGAFLDRVVVQQDMPPSGSLNACQIQGIQQWILDGAPNN